MKLIRNPMGGLMNEKRAVRVLTLRTIAASVIGMSSLLATDARAQLSLQEQIDQLSNAVGRLGATADSLAGSINNINDRLANSSLPSPGTGQNSVALGKNSNASATDSTALGNSASATGDASVALGKGANASADYLLASAASEIWLQPTGELGLLGVASETTFLRGALDKLRAA